MNKRIVIICRFSEEQAIGILKTLGATHRSYPFVRTYLYDYEAKHYLPKITQSNPYLYLRRDKVSTESINDWQALLIADTLETKHYPNGIFDSDTLVMYHTVPSNMTDYLDKMTVSAKKQGQHEPGDEHGYPLVNYLVAAYDESRQNFKEIEFNDALERLIEWFGINNELEAKLNLLHDCLHPNKVPKLLDGMLADKYGGAFDDFRSEVTGKAWCDGEYIAALTKLRQSLLGS